MFANKSVDFPGDLRGDSLASKSGDRS